MKASFPYEEIVDNGLRIYKKNLYGNEGLDSMNNPYKRCWRCNKWKPAKEFSPVVLLSYPAQYVCIECDKGHQVDPKEIPAKTLGPVKLYDDKNLSLSSVTLSYKAKINQSNIGVVYCPYKIDEENK